jgi:ATP/maltotriose-dependent transcriptional regulator MalT
VAAVFATLGIWLGLKLTRRSEVVVVREVPVPAAVSFVRDQVKLESLGITPRELEILELIAEGLSNKEIAARVFVSENTVKTHSSRVFDKLGARRRTQAVQLGKAFRLIP